MLTLLLAPPPQVPPVGLGSPCRASTRLFLPSAVITYSPPLPPPPPAPRRRSPILTNVVSLTGSPFTCGASRFGPSGGQPASYPCEDAVPTPSREGHSSSAAITGSTPVYLCPAWPCAVQYPLLSSEEKRGWLAVKLVSKAIGIPTAETLPGEQPSGEPGFAPHWLGGAIHHPCQRQAGL